MNGDETFASEELLVDPRGIVEAYIPAAYRVAHAKAALAKAQARAGATAALAKAAQAVLDSAEEELDAAKQADT